MLLVFLMLRSRKQLADDVGGGRSGAVEGAFGVIEEEADGRYSLDSK